MDNLLQDFHLEGRQKWVLLGGIGLVIVLAIFIRSRMNSTATSSDSTATPTATMAAPNYTADSSGYGYDSSGTYGGGTGYGSSAPGYGDTGTGITGDTGVGGTPSTQTSPTTGGAPIGATPKGGQVTVTPSVVSITQPSAAPVAIAAHQTQADITAGQQWSSNVANIGATTQQNVDTIGSAAHTNIVKLYNEPGYAVAQGGSSYNASVNAADGQWLDHQWAAGQYNPSTGQFVAANAASAAIYNKAEQELGRPQITAAIAPSAAAPHLNGTSHPAVTASHTTPVKAPAKTVAAAKPSTRTAPAAAKQPVTMSHGNRMMPA